MITAKGLSKELSSYLKAKPQGLQIWVQHQGKTVFETNWGRTWPIYDLASLTKIIFTTTAFMRAHQEHGLSLNAPLSRFLPTDSKIPLLKFLNHTSGLLWWKPFYKSINVAEPVPWRWNLVKEQVLKEIPPSSGEEAVYSDLNFFILAWVLEEIYGQSLLSLFRSLQDENWIPPGFHFRPLSSKFKNIKFYAPTEKCSRRKKILQGEVHDDNAWALGGVAPHAGLFGSMKDIKSLANLWRDVGKNRSTRWPLKKSTLKKFTKRSVNQGLGDFGLGFMLPTPGSASSGQYLSDTSFGHTGFTGTSLWLDLEQDIVIAMLSNRVYPKRDQVDFRAFRPWIHNLVLAPLARVK